MHTAVEILHAASNIPERKLNSGHFQFVQRVEYAPTEFITSVEEVSEGNSY
jgi:hypothetical protein